MSAMVSQINSNSTVSLLIVAALLALCEGNPHADGKFPSQEGQLLPASNYSPFDRKFRNRWNTLRRRQNGRLFADDNFKCIFLNGNVCISIKVSLKFVPNGPIDNKSALVQMMTWHRVGNKPLFEPMIASFTDAYMLDLDVRTVLMNHIQEHIRPKS